MPSPLPHSMANTCAKLKENVLRITPQTGKYLTAIPGLQLTRWDSESQTDTCFYAPSIGVILQGQKKSVLGTETLAYGELDCLVNGVDMPSQSRMTKASPEKPLLAVSLSIEKNLAAEIAAQIAFTPASLSTLRAAGNNAWGISVAQVKPDVLDTFARLVDLLDNPEQIPLMAPLLIKELIARVLMGPQGDALRMIYTFGTHSNQVAEAITWLRAHYTQPLHIEALAEYVHMATSTFHRQFKKVTSLSPLQFQKYLRLYEAQRLMLSETMDACNAGRAVGYDSTQQFNREYKRLFGQPPHRDIKRMLYTDGN